jgi:hypothetical protein
MFAGVHEAVELGLSPMERVGFGFPSALDGFDFLEHDLVRRNHEPVDAPLDAQEEIARIDFEAKAQFLLIARGARTLEPLMAANPRERPARSDEVAFAAEVAASQGELDQLADLNDEDRFGGPGHGQMFGPVAKAGNRISGKYLRTAVKGVGWIA